MTYPFPNFIGCTVEVWIWENNFIPNLLSVSLLIHAEFKLLHVIYCPIFVMVASPAGASEVIRQGMIEIYHLTNLNKTRQRTNRVYISKNLLHV